MTKPPKHIHAKQVFNQTVPGTYGDSETLIVDADVAVGDLVWWHDRWTGGAIMGKITGRKGKFLRIGFEIHT